MKIYYYTSFPLISINPDTSFAKDFIKVEPFTGTIITSEEDNPRSLPPMRYKVTIEVHENDSSYRHRALMEKTLLVLKFSLPEYIEFPVGAWCEWMNQTFYLGCPANFKKNGPRNFEYTLNMGTLENGMADYKLHNSVDGRLKWSMCAKPHEFIEEIVKNLNERDGDGVWKVGDCIDAPEKTVEFNHTYVDTALQSVADAFGTEYEISENLTISLHKVEYFKTDPLALSYGRGNGFVPGVGRTSQSDEKPIKRLYVEGTDRNIDQATYGAAELRLPKGKTLKYDGSYYEGEEGFVEANAHTYTSDADGTYIYRSDKISQAVKEDSLDCSEIYPSREGVVSSLVVVDANKNFYDIIDNTIPADLDFSAYIIPGETMTMIFQSGMLAGKEFEVTYHHEAKTVNGKAKSGRRFEIKPTEFDGVIMPNETFKPVAGGENPDKYAIFGIQLPQAYICNDEDKSGASWVMFKEAARHLYEHEEQKFTFTGELQGLWAKRNWMAIGGRLKVGGYVLFTDEHFAKDGTLIRITGIKDYLTSPYSPTIEISNSISGSSSASKNLRSIDQSEVVIKDTEDRMKQFTKRRFRDAKETIEMLDEALLNFDNSISPVAVQTMAMLVGDESLQFQFVQPIDTEQGDGSTKRTWQRVDDTIQYSNEGKRLHIDHCFIEHLTLGINTIKANRDGEEYKHWEMDEYESPILDQTDKRYYLYAAVNKVAAHGSFILSSKPIPFAGGNGSNGDVTVYPYNYYLLVGVLNSEYADERSFASLYGFTEILPGRITVDKLVSNDGDSIIDLANGTMKLGSELIYDVDVNGNKALWLKFILAENANLGGWIFRNNRLESENGNVWLNGKNGDMRLAGTVQLSSAYQGNISDSNLFFLPAITSEKILTMGYEAEDIGKVCRLYNASPLGGATYKIALSTFCITKSEEVQVTDATLGTIYAQIAPQEVIEVTCFRVNPSSYTKPANSLLGKWYLTNRFAPENFRTEGVSGRFARIMAMGRMVGSESGCYVTGKYWDSRVLSVLFTCSREEKGVYKVTFSQGLFPNNIKVFCTGYGSTVVDARISEITPTSITFALSDDASTDDGSCDFMIMAPDWEYDMSIV